MTPPPKPQRRTIVRLAEPPVNADFGRLLRILLDAGVRPPTSSKAGTPWGSGEFYRHLPYKGQEAKQLTNILEGQSLPRLHILNAMEAALFGSDPQDYQVWRTALRAAHSKQRKTPNPPVRKDRENAVDATEVALAVQSIDRPTAVLDRVRRPPADNLTPDPPERTHIRVPIHFHGRDEAVQDIRALLVRDPHRVAVHGINGVGKTLLAARYAQQFRDDYQQVVWIDAETAEGCRNGLCRVVQSPSQTASDEALSRALVKLAETNEKTLLIYDNAPNARDVARYLPGGSRAHILITSNSPNWRAEAEPYELKVWIPSVGASFFERRLGGQCDHAIATALSQDLGGLPIAHEVAATYCERMAVSLDLYRQRLAAQPSRTLLEAGSASGAYPRSIASAFDLSIEAAMREHSGARTMIECLAVLAPEPVPLTLLDSYANLLEEPHPFLRDAHDTDEAVAALRNYSLLSKALCFAAGTRNDGGEGVRVHRLVQQAVRIATAYPDRVRRITIDAIGLTFSNDYDSSYRTGAPLTDMTLGKHITAFLCRDGEIRNDVPSHSLARVAAHKWMSKFQMLRGKPAEARPHSETALLIVLESSHSYKDNLVCELAFDLHAIYAVLDLDEEFRTILYVCKSEEHRQKFLDAHKK